MTRRMLTVEVAYALPERQTLLRLRVPSGTTVADVLVESGIYAAHPEAQAPDVAIGIFGKVVAPDHQPVDGDRIELYRPLIADAKASRNARVAKKRLTRENVRNMRA